MTLKMHSNEILNDCNNYFTPRLLLKPDDARIIFIANTILMPVNIVANLLVFISLTRGDQKQLRRWRIYTMFRMLTISNMSLGVLTQPMVIILFSLYSKEHYCLLEAITHYSYFLFSYTSAFIILVIGIDYLILQSDLFWYRYALTRRKFLILLLSLIAITLVVCTGYIIATIFGKYIYNKLFLSAITLTSTVLVLARTIWGQNTSTVVLFKKTMSKIQNTCAKSGMDHSCTASKIVKIILSFSTATYMFAAAAEANIIYIDRRGYTNDGSAIYAVILYTSMTFVYLNSIVNPAVIIFYGNRWCKSIFSKNFKKLRLSWNSQSTVSESRTS